MPGLFAQKKKQKSHISNNDYYLEVMFTYERRLFSFVYLLLLFMVNLVIMISQYARNIFSGLRLSALVLQYVGCCAAVLNTFFTIFK